MRITRRAFVPAAAGITASVAGYMGVIRPRVDAQDAATPGATPSGAAATPLARDVIAYALPGDAVYPEGVAFDAATGQFYVGSNADGTIYRGDLATGEVTVFAGADAGLGSVNGLKVDADGRLWASGAATGRATVFDTTTDALIGQATNGLGENETFVNDVTVTADGVGYFADSIAPQLWRIPGEVGQLGAAEIIPLDGTVYEYGEGFNANGIQLTADESALIIADSRTGSLFRYVIETGEVSAIADDADLSGCDGLALDGDILYVCRNSVGRIARLILSADASAATFVDEFFDESFAFPTTIALTDRDTILVCNAQFDRRETGDPVLPFTVVEVPLPPLPEDVTAPDNVAATPTAGTPAVEVGEGQDQDADNATPVATPAA